MILLSFIAKLLLALGLLGLLSSSVYCGLVLFVAGEFVRRRRVDANPAAYLRPLSLLKPLHGDEPDLASRLEGFFQQDYPAYEILFCARHSEDAGLQVARQVAARYPQIPVQFLTTGEPAYTNAKVASLELMARHARFGVFIVSDSDVRVGRRYLREVAAPFAADLEAPSVAPSPSDRVGLVTCLYRGVADGAGLWSRLEAAAMSVEMSAGVLVAERMEGMKFALGPTMAVRRECVDELGGFGMLGRYCADDFVLGNQIAERGHRVVLSTHVIDHVILNSSFLESVKHQIRWMKSTRFSRPRGHFGTALTYSTPFGLLFLVMAVMLGLPLLGLAALAWSIVNRLLMATVVGGSVVQDRRLLQTVLLYPLRDLMGFGYWVASYGSNRILWRGEVFELLRDGVMRRFKGKKAAQTLGEETLTPPRS